MHECPLDSVESLRLVVPGIGQELVDAVTQRDHRRQQQHAKRPPDVIGGAHEVHDEDVQRQHPDDAEPVIEGAVLIGGERHAEQCHADEERVRLDQGDAPDVDAIERHVREREADDEEAHHPRRIHIGAPGGGDEWHGRRDIDRRPHEEQREDGDPRVDEGKNDKGADDGRSKRGLHRQRQHEEPDDAAGDQREPDVVVPPERGHPDGLGADGRRRVLP